MPIRRKQAANLKLPLISIVIAAIVQCLCVESLYAQAAYSPDHPKVEKMVNSALKYIRKSKNSPEQNCIAALAIVQASKRYNAEIPVGDKFVDNAVAEIRKGVNGGQLLNAKEHYYPCLALILLCEVDADLYRSEIDKLVDAFEKQQLKDGAFTYRGKNDWDTSQTQFVALAYFVARQHNVDVKVSSAKRILEFMLAAQKDQTWHYRQSDRKEKISIHAACAGTVYLLGDLLKLQPRVKKVEKQRVAGFGDDIPPAISVFIPEKTASESADGEDGPGQWAGKGPLVEIDKRKMVEVKRGANSHFEKAFTYTPKNWVYYYMYALERYAFFREQTEGSVGNGALRTWYDGGVKLFASLQKPDGSLPEGPERTSPAVVNTAFAVLFLVRSSEILSLPPSSSSLSGGTDLARLSGQKLKELKGGQIQTTEASQNLNALLDSLNEDLTAEQLAILTDSLKSAIRDYQNRPATSRTEAQSFLRSLVKDKNYFKRLIAVRFLAGEQNLDNAPALIYAMGDPDTRICVEAHNGLRLISRKIDSIKLPDNPSRADLDSAKEKWASWYTKLRPGAELYD